eukprot:TRINITY_DN33734_c0_g1_i1.p1 TRINITY_DN33734_c0_g1~~TRINITY_DN33734_c0_g1_i1.p1  ORF type:complete len:397 (+),score=117.09 TRINITY_DN33734_c0_g1_i1:53-1243(+)
MMQAVVLGLTVCAVGAVMDVRPDDVTALFDVLRSEDEPHMVLLYDSTIGGGAFARKFVGDVESQLTLYADCYAADVAEHRLKWMAQAFNMKEEPGYAFLFYGTSATPSTAKGKLHRPGGVKKPATYAGPLANLKGWVQSKQPDPKGLQRLSPKKEEEILKIVGATDGDTLVVYTDKDKVSPALRAIVARVGNTVGSTVLAKVKNGNPFGVVKLPTLVLYAEAGEKRIYEGKMEREEIETFVGKEPKEDRMKLLKSKDNMVWEAAVKKHRDPVIPVKTQEEWTETVVGEGKGLVMVAFLDEADEEFSDMMKVLKQAVKQHSAIQSAAWVPTSISADLRGHFDVDPNSIMFISNPTGKYIRFTGSKSRLSRFIDGPLKRSKGAKDLGTLPSLNEQNEL